MSAQAPTTDVTSVLAASGVTVTFGAKSARQVVAVDDVSLSVGAGEIVGLVGESGSGKSTFALVAAGLHSDFSGEVTVLGRDVRRMRDVRDHRADVQMVFQDPHGSLDPRQRIGRGLRELRQLHPVRSRWIDDDALMEHVGLSSDILGRLPHELSGGQAQRVSIARCLLLRPRLVVADEPTSALDVSVQAQILSLLLRVRDDDEVSILFISHDLAVVRQVCERVHVMRRGVVVEHGETAAVLDAPTHEYTRRLVAAVPGSASGSRFASAVAGREGTRR